METISFARGAPSPDLLPLDELADCTETVLAHDGRTILSYGAGAGYAPLRELIGEWFEVHPGRVLLTNGGLQQSHLTRFFILERLHSVAHGHSCFVVRRKLAGHAVGSRFCLALSREPAGLLFRQNLAPLATNLPQWRAQKGQQRGRR